METNNLAGGHYLEPYAGGAGVAIDLLFHGHAEHIHINDLDPAVHNFWIAVTRHSVALLNLIDITPITMDEWHKWRAILRGEHAASEVERGFATLFMNRTNRSGILKAGVIGGKSQAGEYKLDARFKKDVISARIEKIASYAAKITVHNEDALKLLKNCASFLPRRSLVYLDPPYYIKGSGLYRNFYDHEDHLAIANVLRCESFAYPWVVSYDAADQICEMYKFARNYSYRLNYTAQKRYVGNEVMFFSKQLVVSESNIPQSQLAA
jgi:DNA adenine methylase